MPSNLNRKDWYWQFVAGKYPYLASNDDEKNNNINKFWIKICLFNFENMYIIYRNIWNKNWVRYNTNNYSIYPEKLAMIINNDFPNTFLNNKLIMNNK